MIRTQTKRIVRAVYAFRCGYCGVSEAQVGSELTDDHFRPQSKKGTDDVANLIYACHACNEFKGDYWFESNNTRLLQPLTDNLTLHFTEAADGTLHSITELGQIFINQIRLNRPALVANRLETEVITDRKSFGGDDTGLTQYSVRSKEETDGLISANRR